jgi:hypothetical protein
VHQSTYWGTHISDQGEESDEEQEEEGGDMECE